MYKTFINIIVDFVNTIGVALVAKEPDNPGGCTSARLMIYRDTLDNILTEESYIVEEGKDKWTFYLLPQEDRMLRLLGLKAEMDTDGTGVVKITVDAPEFKAEYKLKDVVGSTEIPF